MQLVVKDDKLQKYRDHVQTGVDLNGKDKEMFDRYFFAFTNLLDGLSERRVVELLMNCPAPLGQLSQSQSYNVVNAAQEIFGALNFNNSKKIAHRYIYATRLEEMSDNMERLALEIQEKGTRTLYDEDGAMVMISSEEAEMNAGIMIEKAANVRMKAAKIKGLLDKDVMENPNQYKVAPNIIYTDDLEALALNREIEDTGYENVTGDEGETEEGATVADGQEG